MTTVADPSFIEFSEETLGLKLYDWQEDAVTAFDEANVQLVQVSLATPNGSGKSAVVIPTLALGWLALYPRGRVVLTTADGKQLDGQVMPALESHRAKFPHWKFIEREITTPTGGRFVAFTTDDAGRAEGWHKLNDDDGPLLIIADEAKTIPDAIFSAIDRCTYNAILLTSSPGHMVGRFYESQFKPDLGYIVIRIGLKDCPHITQDKIDRIVAAHGRNSAFARSTLDGEFMEATGEARFDADGLTALEEMCNVEETLPKALQAELGELIQQERRALQWIPNPKGWVWIREAPTPGCSYLGFCDPMTGAQSEGAVKRDTHAAGILRLSYIDERQVEHDDEVVAVLHHEGGCRWDNDILADRLSSLLLHYDDAPVIVEANNAGTEVMRLLIIAGRTLWRREKPNHRLPGKKMIDVVGFQTTDATKAHWVGALGRHIRERLLICRYREAVRHFQHFVLDEKGKGNAQANCFDDFVTGVGMAIFARASAKRMTLPPPPVVFGRPQQASAWS